MGQNAKVLSRLLLLHLHLHLLFVRSFVSTSYFFIPGRAGFLFIAIAAAVFQLAGWQAGGG